MRHSRGCEGPLSGAEGGNLPGVSVWLRISKAAEWKSGLIADFEAARVRSGIAVGVAEHGVLCGGEIGLGADPWDGHRNNVARSKIGDVPVD